ncbi:hypothetical protein T11_9461, partial [Trichinella zimbabwensis]
LKDRLRIRLEHSLRHSIFKKKFEIFARGVPLGTTGKHTFKDRLRIRLEHSLKHSIFYEVAAGRFPVSPFDGFPDSYLPGTLMSSTY